MHIFIEKSGRYSAFLIKMIYALIPPLYWIRFTIFTAKILFFYCCVRISEKMTPTEKISSLIYQERIMDFLYYIKIKYIIIEFYKFYFFCNSQSSRLFSVNRKSYTLIVTIPRSSRCGRITSFTMTIFLKSSFALISGIFSCKTFSLSGRLYADCR